MSWGDKFRWQADDRERWAAEAVRDAEALEREATALEKRALADREQEERQARESQREERNSRSEAPPSRQQVRVPLRPAKPTRETEGTDVSRASPQAPTDQQLAEAKILMASFAEAEQREREAAAAYQPRAKQPMSVQAGCFIMAATLFIGGWVLVLIMAYFGNRMGHR